MLQKARLAVLQNKNQYDAKGCVGALEKCMLDDMVCGDDYVKCIDPTKRYIDENGEVVIGQQITSIFGHMLNYNNTAVNADFIRTAVTSGKVCQEKDDGSCVVNYLMQKIGTGQTVKNGGLCRAVLDKCQDYTYTANNASSVYNPYNDVIVNYIQRAMVNIKAAQARIVSDYAANCLTDMSACYNQQLTQINDLSTAVSIENVRKVMTGACRNVALTCGYAVLAYDKNLNDDCGSETDDPATSNYARSNCVVEKISEVFYQSLLCSENSTYQAEALAPEDLIYASMNRTIGGYINARCQCNFGYTVWEGACVPTCSNDEYRNNYGVCTKCEDGTYPNGWGEGDGCDPT